MVPVNTFVISQNVYFNEFILELRKDISFL